MHWFLAPHVVNDRRNKHFEKFKSVFAYVKNRSSPSHIRSSIPWRPPLAEILDPRPETESLTSRQPTKRANVSCLGMCKVVWFTVSCGSPKCKSPGANKSFDHLQPGSAWAPS